MCINMYVHTFASEAEYNTMTIWKFIRDESKKKDLIIEPALAVVWEKIKYGPQDRFKFYYLNLPRPLMVLLKITTKNRMGNGFTAWNENQTFIALNKNHF